MFTNYLIQPTDLTKEELNDLMSLAEKIMKDPVKYQKACEGKIAALLFFEPSTRTRLSFEAAMLRLGGEVIGFSDLSSSSRKKGESLADTLRTVENYSDIVVMRHPKSGSALHASKNIEVPLINAGDGGNQHPTQTLADLLTIKESKGEIANLKVGFCGDLMFGRTVHSLVEALTLYDGVEYVFISPEELKLPEYFKEVVLKKNDLDYEEYDRLEDCIDELDILYMTRVQKERFFNEEDYIRLKDYFILTDEILEEAKEDLVILHPLPRVNEIDVSVDEDPRAWYFRQAKFGMYMRMALLMTMLGVTVDD